MGDIRWTNRVGEVVPRFKDERYTMHQTKRRKANFTGYILRSDSLLKHTIEGKTIRDLRDGKLKKKM